MNYSHDFNERDFIAKLQEAERLAKLGEAGNVPAMIRWGIVGDECTHAIQLAEEMLEPAELEALYKRTEQTLPGLWAKYKFNPRRVKQMIGDEMWSNEPRDPRDEGDF